MEQQVNPIMTPEELNFLNRRVELKNAVLEAIDKAVNNITDVWIEKTEHFTDGLDDLPAAFVQGQLDSLIGSFLKKASLLYTMAEAFLERINPIPPTIEEEDENELPI